MKLWWFFNLIHTDGKYRPPSIGSTKDIQNTDHLKRQILDLSSLYLVKITLVKIRLRFELISTFKSDKQKRDCWKRI